MRLHASYMLKPDAMYKAGRKSELFSHSFLAVFSFLATQKNSLLIL